MIDRIEISTRSEGGNLVRNRKLINDAVLHFDGKDVTLTIERKRKKRSTEQNRYLWGVVYPIIQGVLRDLGTLMSKEDVHIMMRLKVAEIEDELIYEHILNEDEIIGKRMRSTTEYTTAQFMDYITHIQMWAAETLGVSIPDPNEQLTIE